MTSKTASRELLLTSTRLRHLFHWTPLHTHFHIRHHLSIAHS